MLKFKSHKTVEAARIHDYQDGEANGLFVLLLDGGETVTVDGDWVVKHNPDIENLIGGYFVKYADGYKSWSPAEAFEGGYAVVPDGPDASLIDDETLAKKLAGQTAPRVTKEAMNSRIATVAHCQLGETTVLCQITLDNGYTVRGEASCVDPANFDPDIGARISYDNAYEKLWPLFGFLLAEALHQAKHPGFANVMATANAEIDKADGEAKGFEDVSEEELDAAAEAFGKAMHKVAAGEVGDGI